MTVLSDYQAAIDAVETAQDSIEAAQDPANETALDSQTLAEARGATNAALAALHGDDNKDRVLNKLTNIAE